MARTLSDTLIIAMIEAATRLASGRGPIAGSSAAAAQGAAVSPPAGSGAAKTGVEVTPAAGAGQAGDANAGAAGAPPAGAGGQDTRSAEEIAADFKTIYQQIEEVVRTSAEQESKTVGFGVR